jgi:hypothetical protein
MAYDYGLIGGLGQGIQKGLETFMKMKQLNRENQIQNLTAGVETDEQGNLKFTPEEQTKRQDLALQTHNTGLLQQGQLAVQQRQTADYDLESSIKS